MGSCDAGSDQGGNLGYTAQLLFEVDGLYRGDACVLGSNGIPIGGYPLTYRPRITDGFPISWRGEGGVLEIVGEAKGGDSDPPLFTDRLGADFAAMPQQRTLEHEVEGHRVIIYAENLGLASNCATALHSKADYDGTSNGGDGGPGETPKPNVPTNVPSLFDLDGTAPDDVWGVGFDGVVLHYDGHGWTQTVDDESLDLLTVWAPAPGGDLWVVARSYDAAGESRKLLRGRPGAWVEVDPETLAGELVDRAWGTGPDDIWVTGHIEDEGGGGRSGVVHHFSGGTWSMPASYVGGRLGGVWGSAADDVFIGGSDGSGYGGYVAHFADGKFDSNEYPDQWVGCVWGTGPKDVWTAGGTLTHYDGSQWVESTQLPGRFHQFYGLWGSASNDVWAVGSQGVSMQDYSGFMLHWNGSTWSEASVRPITQVNDVWGTAANDVWVVGSHVIYHFDGSTWRTTAPSEITIAP